MPVAVIIFSAQNGFIAEVFKSAEDAYHASRKPVCRMIGRTTEELLTALNNYLFTLTSEKV